MRAKRGGLRRVWTRGRAGGVSGTDGVRGTDFSTTRVNRRRGFVYKEGAQCAGKHLDLGSMIRQAHRCGVARCNHKGRAEAKGPGLVVEKLTWASFKGLNTKFTLFPLKGIPTKNHEKRLIIFL